MKHNIITPLVIAASAFLMLAAPARAGLLDAAKKAKDAVTSTPKSQPASPQTPPAQQSTPQQTTNASQTQSQPFTVTPDMSPKDVVQAWLDAIYAGDVQKAKATCPGSQQDYIESWEMAQKWGGKPVKHVIERVETDFDKVYVHCRPVAGIEPIVTLTKQNGVWRISEMKNISFGIALPGDEGEWKEGSPAKVARTWFDAMAAADWEKVSSVTSEDNPQRRATPRSDSATLLRQMKIALEAGKKILPVSIDYLRFNGRDVGVNCSTGEEKYYIRLGLEGDAWLVMAIPRGKQGITGGRWPTKEFWEGVKLQ